MQYLARGGMVIRPWSAESLIVYHKNPIRRSSSIASSRLVHIPIVSWLLLSMYITHSFFVFAFHPLPVHHLRPSPALWGALLRSVVFTFAGP